MARVRIRKNDVVEVVSGKDRGKRGRVLRVMPEESLLLVEGVNIQKRHTRPNPQRNVKGGILEKEGPVHLSNVMLIDPQTDRRTRVGVQVLEDGSRARVAKRSGAVLAR